MHAATSVDYTGATTRTDTMMYGNGGNTQQRTINGVVTDFTYNSENQFAAANVHTAAGDQQTSHLYDGGGGLLIRKDPGGATLYAAGQEYKAVGGTVSATRYYGHGGATVAVRNSSGLFWLAADHQASASVTVNAATASVQRRWYTPYGGDRAIQGTWPTDRGFLNTQNNGSTGLLDVGAREYDPNLGVFTSPDPLVNIAEPATFNAYAYAGSSPITHSDPSGLLHIGGDNGAPIAGSAVGVPRGGGEGGGAGGSSGGDPMVVVLGILRLFKPIVVYRAGTENKWAREDKAIDAQARKQKGEIQNENRAAAAAAQSQRDALSELREVKGGHNVTSPVPEAEPVADGGGSGGGGKPPKKPRPAGFPSDDDDDRDLFDEFGVTPGQGFDPNLKPEGGRSYITYGFFKDGKIAYVGLATGRGSPTRVMWNRISQGHDHWEPGMTPQVLAALPNRGVARGSEEFFIAGYRGQGYVLKNANQAIDWSHADRAIKGAEYLERFFTWLLGG